jgi:hypothetical protein
MINDINKYRFVIQWDKSPQRAPSSTRLYDTVAHKLPPTEEGGKEGAVRDEIRRRENWLRTNDFGPGSFIYKIETEKIAQLKALVPRDVLQTWEER